MPKYKMTVTQTWTKEFPEDEIERYKEDNGFEDDEEALDEMVEEYKSAIEDDPNDIPDGAALEIESELIRKSVP